MQRRIYLALNQSSRKYATNSPMHLTLQAELTDTMREYRAIKNSINERTALKALLDNYGDANLKLTQQTRTQYRLTSPDRIQAKLTSKMQSTLNKGLLLVAEINKECLTPDDPSEVAIKLMK